MIKSEESLLYRIVLPIGNRKNRIFFDFIEPLAEIEGEQEREWYVRFAPSLFCTIFESLYRISPFFECFVVEEVSWEEQSSMHSPYWKAETQLLHIPLIHTDELLLKTGAIFGDGSHPTTQLMLSHLPLYVKDRAVIDIGHGNGILTLAAHLYGAKEAIGLEIDEDAVLLAKHNRALNGIDENQVHFYDAKSYPIFNGVEDKQLCLLMNMVMGDMEKAILSLSHLFDAASSLLVSGILSSQRGDFLKMIAPYEFQLEEKKELDSWLFLALQKKP